MSQVGDLRSALRDNLKSVPGMRMVYAYVASNPSPPCLQIWPSEIPAYHKTFGVSTARLAEVQFTVQAIVTMGTDVGGQQIMDELLDADGARSVSAAVESDPTLGGLSHDVYCTSNGGYGFLVRADSGTQLLTADWLVTVIV